MGEQIRVDVYSPIFVGSNYKSYFIDKWSLNSSSETLDTMELNISPTTKKDEFASVRIGSLVIVRNPILGVKSQGITDERSRHIGFVGIVTSKSINKLFLTEYMTVFDTDVAITPVPYHKSSSYPLLFAINRAKETGNAASTRQPTIMNMDQLRSTTWSMSTNIIYVQDKSQPRPTVIYDTGIINIYNELLPYTQSLQYYWRYDIIWKNAPSDYNCIIDHIQIVLVDGSPSASNSMNFIENYNISNVTVDSRAGGVDGATISGGIQVDTGKVATGELRFMTSWPVKYMDYTQGDPFLNLQRAYKTPFPVRIDIRSSSVDSSSGTAPSPNDLLAEIQLAANSLFWTEPLEVGFDFNLFNLMASTVGRGSLRFWTGAPCFVISNEYINNTINNNMPRITSIAINSESYVAQVTVGYKRLNLIGL